MKNCLLCSLLISAACRTQTEDKPDPVDTADAQDVDNDGFSADEDCDDEDSAIHPGAEEVCDGGDNDCDGFVDEDVLSVFYVDLDEDGHGDDATAVEACAAPEDHVSMGGDCDDGNSAIHPDRQETCDFIDNNCDQVINEGLDCRVYASSYSTVYRVDPFVFDHETVVDSPLPGLFDLALGNGGELYGLGPQSLFLYEEAAGEWSLVGEMDHSGESLNALSVDSSGAAFATIGDTVHRIDLQTAAVTEVGLMGGFASSGGCAFDVDDRLYMTSLNDTGAGDDLVWIDAQTGEGTLLGNIGFSGVTGLSAVSGHLFGFTVTGKLLLINPEDGAAVLLHEFDGLSFTGAASNLSK